MSEQNLSKKFVSYFPKLVKFCQQCYDDEEKGRKNTTNLFDKLSKTKINEKDEIISEKLSLICNTCEDFGGCAPEVADYIKVNYNKYLPNQDF